MMMRNKVKPCQKASFNTPEDFWYHCVGKSNGGCHLHYSLCRIIEYGFPMYTHDRKRMRTLDTGYIDDFRKKINLSVKVSNGNNLCE